MSKEVPQAPHATKGSTPSNNKEGKYVIDRPTRVKCCLKCWQPLYFKSDILYCPTCKKFRNVKTSHWIDHITRIQYLTKGELGNIIAFDDER